MFAGSHDHVIDDKGRTSLPKEFRLLLAECNGDAWLTALRDCLAIFTPETFSAFHQKLGSASIAVEPVQQIQRLLVGMAAPCPLDKQGRILIPPGSRSGTGRGTTRRCS
jgi:MraZ protein